MWDVTLFAYLVLNVTCLPGQQARQVGRMLREQGSEGLQGLLVRVLAVFLLLDKPLLRNLCSHHPSISVEP